MGFLSEFSKVGLVKNHGQNLHLFQMRPISLALILSFAAVSTAFTSPFVMPSTNSGDLRACPKPMDDFELTQVSFIILDYPFENAI